MHGGGWTTDAQMQATLRDLAQRGWLVVRPEYPLASPGRPTWQEAPRSLARSYAWVARHAGTLGGDPRRISVFGDSAGGGLAVNLADRIAAGTLDGIDDAAALPVPRAVVALYPTVDVAAVQRVRALGAGKAAEEFVGGTPAEPPERYQTLDARTWATRGDPPTLIIRGGADTFVPPDSVRASSPRPAPGEPRSRICGSRWPITPSTLRRASPRATSWSQEPPNASSPSTAEVPSPAVAEPSPAGALRGSDATPVTARRGVSRRR
ncbi:Lipase 2 [Rothia kristinae]|nr:Lipase 2 [Rothia kristinae]